MKRLLLTLTLLIGLPTLAQEIEQEIKDEIAAAREGCRLNCGCEISPEKLAELIKKFTEDRASQQALTNCILQTDPRFKVEQAAPIKDEPVQAQPLRMMPTPKQIVGPQGIIAPGHLQGERSMELPPEIEAGMPK